MALVLDFNICQKYNCKEILFTETTGTYSVTNTTGWGAPNPLTGSATSATLAITKYGTTSTTYTLNLFTSSFPTTNLSSEYSVTADLIGGTSGDVITDGIYTFVYTVVVGETTYTQTKMSTLTCNVQCCVQSMLKDIDFECDCSEDAKEKYIDAYILLKGLQSNCGSTDDFERNLETLQALCQNSNCDNCQ